MNKALKYTLQVLSTSRLALLFSSLILLLCLMPSDKLIQDVNDKLAHVIAFAGITFLWLFAKRKLILVTILCIAFGALIEILQSNLPQDFHRSGDWMDVLADGGGVLIGLLVFLLFERFLKHYKLC